MKKILIFILLALVILSSCTVTRKSQSKALPSDLYFGTSPNSGTGESLNSAMHKLQLLIDEAQRLQLDQITATGTDFNVLDNLDPNTIFIGDVAILTAQVDAALTDNTPSDAEITAALGGTAAVKGKNYTRLIKDTSGSGLIYLVTSDGTSWQYIKLTIAV